MNTAVRTYNHGIALRANSRTRLNFKKYLSTSIIVIALLLSAISVIYVKDLNRRLFSDLQVLESGRDNLNVEWGQLLLEQSAWSTQSRVQKVAQTELNMLVPNAKDVVMVRI